MELQQLQEKLQELRDHLNLKLVTIDSESMDLMAIGELLRYNEELSGLFRQEELPNLLKYTEKWEYELGEVIAGKSEYKEGLAKILSLHELFEEHLETFTRGGGDAPAPPGEEEQAIQKEVVPVEQWVDVIQEINPDLMDDNTLIEFISECEEGLENTEQTLLQLEENPEDEQGIAAIFRIVHTIKGTSGFLGLPTMGKLAHKTEDFLVQVRDGKRTMTSENVDAVLRSVDVLGKLVNQVKEILESTEPTPIDLSEAYNMLAEALNEESTVSVPTPPPTTIKSPKDPFPEVAQETARKITTHDPETVEFDTVDHLELLPFEVKDDSRKELEEHEYVREIVEQPPQPMVISPEVVDQTESKPEIQMPAEVKEAPSQPTFIEKEKPLKTQQSTEIEKKPVSEVSQSAKVQQDSSSKKTAISSSSHQLVDMLKIPADKLDELAELIGELVVALSVLSQNHKITEIEDRETHDRLDQLHKITEQLRDRILNVRMFPVANVFSKLKRQIRDLSRKSGKKIELVLEGEDTLVDKSIIDSIYAPLMHIVRNAIDHGIESSDDRLIADKPEKGRVELSAKHMGDSILIEVIDDGKGLDRDRILNKAVERGLTTEKETLSDSQIFNFIFQAGFSTAQKVTDVSGRGVGMDVVRREVDQLRGKINIESSKGKGSTFRIKLPLTTSIIEGLVVRLGSSQFVLPILDVHLTITPSRDSLHDVQNQKDEYFVLAGEVVPIIRLYEYYGIEADFKDPAKAIVVVVHDGEKKYGLLVDELMHRQQIVVKNLGKRFKNLPGITGGTILGDGRIGLILDPERLLSNTSFLAKNKHHE